MSTKPPSSDRDAPEDFWDLGDDDLDLDLPKEEVPAPGPRADQTPEFVPDITPAPAAEPPSQPVAMPEPTEPEPTPLPPSPSREVPGTGEKKSRLGSSSFLEKICLLILIAGLLGVGTWGVASYLSDAPQGELITFDEDFPVEGNNISVAEVETWWRKPIRSGEDADRGVIQEIGLIPVARIKLQGSGSETLQINFRDGDQESIGDTITLKVSSGKFEATGSDEITVICTKGFPSPSELNPYTNGDVDPWSVAIEESSGDSEPFAKVRIEPIYK